MFDQFQVDKIKIRKKDTGATSSEIKAMVDPKAGVIHIHTKNLPQGWVVDDGDHIDRLLPADRIERYIVIDSGYKAAWNVFPERYECEVRKATAAQLTSPSSVTYNLNGNNARVYNDSTDNSSNTVSINSEELFAALTKTIHENIADNGELVALVQEMANERGKPRFLNAYRNFMSSAADHMTILSPYLAPLAQLIT